MLRSYSHLALFGTVSGAFQTQLQAIRGDTAELEELRLQVMYRAGLLHLQADLKAATGWG